MLQQSQAQFVERTQCITCASRRLTELSSGRYMDEPLARFIRNDPGGEKVLPFLQSARWALVRCDDCKQVFHKHILNNDWNERRFSEWMDAASIQEFEARSTQGREAEIKFATASSYVSHILRIEKLTRAMRPNREAVRLLDFGCGWGGFLKACDLFGFEAVGVDRATPRIEGAAVPVFPSLQAIGSHQSFHAITLFEVLEHLDEPLTMLTELAGYIMPGGILVLETPDCSGVTDIRSEHDYYKIHPLEHINAFTHDTLVSNARRAGFDEIAQGTAYVTAEYRGAVKSTAKHLLRRDGRSTQVYFRRCAL